jgi:hypothetical protein
MNADWLREIIALVSSSYNKPPENIPRDAMWQRIRLARDYNRPPQAVPRDHMWQRLMRFRASTALPLTPERRVIRMAADAAAGSAAAWRANSRILAPALMLAASVTFVVLRAGAGATASSTPAAAAAITTHEAAATAEWFPGSAAGIRDGSAANWFTAGAYDVWYTAADDDPVSEAYKRAATSHLKQTTLLLGGLNTMTAEDITNRRTVGTVRSLLATTRLLLSSRAAVRVKYRMVFQDLEFVLVRMSLVTTETVETDRMQLQNTIDRRRLMPRMRDLIPVATTSSAN